MDDQALLSLGLWIKRRRKALDLTQDGLAALVGCSKDLIVKIEGDARRPSREIAALLATQLQLAPEERDAFIRCARAELAPDRLPPPSRSVPRAAFVRATGTPAPVPSDPTGMVMFLFTDIVGSTRLWEQHPDAMRAALARHDQIMRQAIGEAGGQVFKTVGDAFHAVFNLPQSALQASLAAQQAISSEGWAALGLSEPIQVRMALHAGTAEWRDGDYFGPPLNRLARLLVAGHGGQVLLSAAAQELLADPLPAEVALRDLGIHRLKDLSRPEHIYQAQAADVPLDFPPLQTLDARPGNLPIQPTPLLGRERELAQVTALLSRGDVRLVTLTGPGGTGKTRLGLQAAAELLDAFADGVFFVDLAPISDPELVVTTIAQTLGVTTTGERPVDQLKAALRHRHLLLLLDNYEQVLGAAPLVAELLAAAARLTVLVTSRVALHHSGEHEYAVPPLALPPLSALALTPNPSPVATGEGSQITAPPRLLEWERRPGGEGDLTQYAAVQLFIQRAQAAKADFAVTNATAPAVAEICVRLDGLPLAIELAAARIKLFTPEALLARLTHPLALLTGGARDLPARQQTIRSTIDWSYNLLNADEQWLFRSLGVFVGGFTLAAAEAVTDFGFSISDFGLGAGAKIIENRKSKILNILDGLASLLDHSLLVVLEPVEGEPRYGMLETLREYALERLRAAGEEIDLRRRHAAFFAAWVEAVQPNINDLETSERIGRELGNFRAALDWSLARSDQDAQYGLWLFGSVWELWFHRYPTEGGAIVERALASASACHQDIVAARIYNAAARLQKNPGGSTRSVELIERSLALARQYDDRPLQAEVLRHLGEATLDGDYQAATQVFEESLRICRELDDAEQEGWTTFNLGIVAWRRADLNQSERHYQRSLALFARLGYAMAQQMVLRNLSMLAERRGDHVAADDYLARAFALSDRFGWAAGFSPLIERGWLACQRGDYQRALDLLQQGYDQARQLGNNWNVWVAFMWQAVCYVELGDLARATQLCRQGLAIALDNVDDVGISQIAMIVANVVMAGGKHVTAACLLGCADSYLATISYKFEHDIRTDWKRLHDRALAACRAALGEEAFQAAWAAGQALTLEQAVAEALNR
jgi:predicted ATPase/class 3 adenylate cyclase